MRPDYEESLHELWRKATAPRAEDAPTVVSTFAGCGGSSLGYHAAGFRELLAVEWEPHAAEQFRLNFPDVPVHEGDVADVGYDAIAMPAGGLTVLDGSPPCQGFSMTGKRRFADPRNTLFMQFVRLATEWQPKFVVMENVPGMARGKTKPIFRACMKAFADAGYRVEARILRGDRCGGASIRTRLYIIGAREDLRMPPPFPTPIWGYTLRDALRHVEDGPLPYVGPKAMQLAPYIKPGQNGAAALMEAGYRSSWWNVQRNCWDRPAYTLLKFNPRNAHLHPDEDRTLTIPEMKRVQGFPDEYRFTGEANKIQDRIGNSVMPPMAYRVAAAVATAIARVPEPA